VIDLDGPAVMPDQLEHRGVGRGRRHRALVVRAVQPLLGRVGVTGPHAGGVRVAEGDQDAGVQGGGEREIGGGPARVGGRLGVEDGRQNTACTRKITRRRQSLRLRGEFGERRGHKPIVLTRIR
jgi:hypothetical protein